MGILIPILVSTFFQNKGFRLVDLALNLVQGTVAALISLLGLFAVFWLTRRHELARQAAEHRNSAENERIRLSAEYAARIVQAALSAPSTGKDSGAVEGCIKLADEIIVMGIRLGHYYPSMLNWTHAISQRLQKAAVELQSAESMSAEVTPTYEQLDRARKLYDQGDLRGFFEATVNMARSPEWLGSFHQIGKEIKSIVALFESWAETKFDVDFVWPVPGDPRMQDPPLNRTP